VLIALCLSLLVLARLDTIFIALSYFGWRVVRVFLRRESVRECLPEALVLGTVLGTYLAANTVFFDTALPISGALKSSFPTPLTGLHFWILAGMPQKLLIINACAFALVIAFWRARRGGLFGEATPTTALALWACGVLGFLCYQLLFGRWGNMFSWYYQPFAFLAAVAAAQWFEGASRVAWRPGSWLDRAATAGVAVVLAGALVSVGHKHWTAGQDFHIASYHAAKWVNASAPRNAVLAMKDSGAFGYFVDRPVINLDGVVNNRAYQEALVRDGVAAYLALEGVDLLAHHSLRLAPPAVKEGGYEVFPLEFWSQLFNRSGGKVLLHREDELYRSPYTGAIVRTSFVIWRLRSPPEKLPPVPLRSGG
jgi:hypothetical protein